MVLRGICVDAWQTHIKAMLTMPKPTTTSFFRALILTVQLVEYHIQDGLSPNSEGRARQISLALDYLNEPQRFIFKKKFKKERKDTSLISPREKRSGRENGTPRSEHLRDDGQTTTQLEPRRNSQSLHRIPTALLGSEGSDRLGSFAINISTAVACPGYGSNPSRHECHPARRLGFETAHQDKEASISAIVQSDLGARHSRYALA